VTYGDYQRSLVTRLRLRPCWSVRHGLQDGAGAVIEADVLSVMQFGLGAWVVGWCMGFLVYTFRRALDLI